MSMCITFSLVLQPIDHARPNSASSMSTKPKVSSKPNSIDIPSLADIWLPFTTVLTTFLSQVHFARTDFATIDQFYIGLNALDGSGKNTWLDGTDVNYTN
uniref:Chitinase n=1 Tax=Panagrellus redivivus TaxID=6233 RepID=A0A7E4UTR3_PANRE